MANLISDIWHKAKTWYLKLRAVKGLRNVSNESLEKSYDAMTEAIARSSGIFSMGDPKFEKDLQDTIKAFQETQDEIIREMQRRGMPVQKIGEGKPYYIKQKADYKSLIIKKAEDKLIKQPTTWEEKEKIYGKPKRGHVYICKLKSEVSGRIIKEKLKWIGMDDVGWRTADDNSEIDEWNWDVIEWKDITKKS